MNVTISFKHLEHTESLDEKIKGKSKKFKKYFEGNFEVQWTCYVDEHEQVAEIKLNGPSFLYHSTGKSDSLYKALDLATSKMEAQLRKKKDQWKDKIHHKHDVTDKVDQLNKLESEETSYQEEVEENLT
ncbi:ribosome-associated translation inhibitor RaiA [Bacteriovoracaceae bacterium]|nr:ribosome-associated translation inhibitor RaiA [Bacteriovoracaceae bacterium]